MHLSLANKPPKPGLFARIRKTLLEIFLPGGLMIWYGEGRRTGSFLYPSEHHCVHPCQALPAGAQLVFLEAVEGGIGEIIDIEQGRLLRINVDQAGD